MLNGQRYPFIDRINSIGQTSTLPYLPIALSNGNKSIEVIALLDTGASVKFNVCFYRYESAFELNPK
jgi:hypothetical protein